MQSTALKGGVIVGGVVVALLVPTAMLLLTTEDDGGGKIGLGIPGVQYEELVSTYRGDLERHGEFGNAAKHGGIRDLQYPHRFRLGHASSARKGWAIR